MTTPIKETPNTAPLTPEELNAKMASQVLPVEPPSKEEREALIAKRTSILDRGLVNHSLKVDVPPEYHQEWGPNDPTYIRDMEDKGFVIDTVYAADKMRTSQGKIPDVISFITPKWNKDLQDEVVNRVNIKKHGGPTDGKVTQSEEREFINSSGHALPIINEGQQEILDATRLEAALDAHIAEKQGEI